MSKSTTKMDVISSIICTRTVSDCFRVLAVVFASLTCLGGQVGAAITLVEAENSGQVTRTGSGWSTRNGSRYSGGTFIQTTNAGDKLTFAFTGQTISVLFVTGRAGGIANITIDGTPYPSFDCWDNDSDFPMSAIIYREVMITNSLSPGAHAIEITLSSSYNPWMKAAHTPTLMADAFKHADFAASALKGKVYDVDCVGVGIGNANIQIDNGTDTFSFVSADDGEYCFSCIPAGTYDMTVSRTEYQTLNRPGIVVGAAATVVDNFVLPEGPGHFLYGKIFAPRMASMPAFVLAGGSFDIEFKANSTASNWDVSISAFEKTIPLNAAPAYDTANGCWILTADIPAGTPLGLYDLTVNSSEGNDTKANSVKVVSTIKDDFYYVHTNDIELLRHPENLPQYEQAQSEFDIINPEFVLIDGDNIGEPTNNVNEFPAALTVFSNCTIPIGIVAGNHDIVTNNQDKIIVGPTSDPTKHAVWKHFFGPHCYEFDYGQAHFIGMEQTCDLDGGGSMEDFDPDQLNWIKNSLNAHPASLNIIYGHPVGTKVPDYFYPFCEAYGVDIAAGGHGTYSSFTQNGVFYFYPGATSRTARQYSLVRINGTNYTTTRLHDFMLSKSYSSANDGTQTILTATIDNGYSEHFEHALVEFIMAPGVYATDNGTILQQFNNDAGTKTFVHVTLDLPASAVTDITVSPAGPDITAPTVSVTSIVIDGTASDWELDPPIVTVAGANLGQTANFSQEVLLTGGTITITAEDTANITTINLNVIVP